MWAERSTVVEGESGARAEAVALWVHLDPASGRPRPLGEEVLATYGPSAGGREVKARLRHPPPPATAASSPWTFRAADLDMAGHVNNAAYWAVLEEELAGRPVGAFEGEVEHRAPAGAGPAGLVSAGRMRWVLGGAGDVHASFSLDPGLAAEG